MKTILRIALTLLLLCGLPSTVAAQSADALYNTGVSQYNNKQYAAAIASFNKSMFVDGSASNKARCNAMIKKCQNPPKTNNNANSGKTGKTYDKVDYSVYKGSKGRYLDEWRETFIPAVQNKKYEKVINTDGDWRFEPASSYPWLKLEKGDKLIKITCEDNMTGKKRTAVVNVFHDGNKFAFSVTQYGSDNPSGVSHIEDTTVGFAGFVVVEKKDKQFVITGVPKNAVVLSCSDWIRATDRKYVKSKNMFKNLKNKAVDALGGIAVEETAAVGSTEMAFNVDPYIRAKSTDPEIRKGFVHIQGKGKYEIQQKCKK